MQVKWNVNIFGSLDTFGVLSKFQNSAIYRKWEWHIGLLLDVGPNYYCPRLVAYLCYWSLMSSSISWGSRFMKRRSLEWISFPPFPPLVWTCQKVLVLLKFPSLLLTLVWREIIFSFLVSTAVTYDKSIKAIKVKVPDSDEEFLLHPATVRRNDRSAQSVVWRISFGKH